MFLFSFVVHSFLSFPFSALIFLHTFLSQDRGRGDNIKMDLKETGWVFAQFMHVTQDRGHWINFRFPQKARSLFFYYRSEYSTLADGWTPWSYTRAVVLQWTRVKRTACWVMTEKSFGNNAVLQANGSCPLKMGPSGCSETSVRNYHYSLRNNPEERSSLLSETWMER